LVSPNRGHGTGWAKLAVKRALARGADER